MKAFTLVLTLIIFTSIKQSDKVFIWFPKDIGVIQTCNGDEVELFIEISTESTEEIQLYAFELNSDFTIYKNNKAFSPTDTLVISKNNPINLIIKYTLNPSNKPKSFNFKSDLSKYSENQIKLNYGQFIITTEDIKEEKEVFVNVSESCHDSIMVIFPYGGTISHITLYNHNDTSQTKKAYKSISYGMGGVENHISFSMSDTGRYFVDFGSCHWGGEFWLTIR